MINTAFGCHTLIPSNQFSVSFNFNSNDQQKSIWYNAQTGKQIQFIPGLRLYISSKAIFYTDQKKISSSQKFIDFDLSKASESIITSIKQNERLHYTI